MPKPLLCEHLYLPGKKSDTQLTSCGPVRSGLTILLLSGRAVGTPGGVEPAGVASQQVFKAQVETCTLADGRSAR